MGCSKSCSLLVAVSITFLIASLCSGFTALYRGQSDQLSVCCVALHYVLQSFTEYSCCDLTGQVFKTCLDVDCLLEPVLPNLCCTSVEIKVSLPQGQTDYLMLLCSVCCRLAFCNATTCCLFEAMFCVIRPDLHLVFPEGKKNLGFGNDGYGPDSAVFSSANCSCSCNVQGHIG